MISISMAIPVFGNNRIAGIPVHIYEAELLYETAKRLLRRTKSSLQFYSLYPVDEANTLFADSYTLLGFQIGFFPVQERAFLFSLKAKI